MSSAIQRIVQRARSAVDLFPLSFPISVSNLPSSIFLQTGVTHRRTQLFVHHLFALVDYPEREGWEESEVKGFVDAGIVCFYLYHMFFALFME